MQDWKDHKSRCNFVKGKYDAWKEEMNRVMPDSNVFDTKEEECAICFEESFINPVALPCGHVFCFECIGSFQWSSDSDSQQNSCPLCRGEIPYVVDKATERMKLYSDRAHKVSMGSEEQKKYANLAYAEMTALAEVTHFEDDMSSLYARMIMIAMIDRPEETIKMTEKVLSLHERDAGGAFKLDFDLVARAQFLQAEAYAACGKWDDAGLICATLYMAYVANGSEKIPIPFIITYSRAMYETHDYEEAIRFGNGAIKMNRTMAGVHKYVALSHKALGNIEEAKKTISRAILYEWHWDKDNMQQNKQILRELRSL